MTHFSQEIDKVEGTRWHKPNLGASSLLIKPPMSMYIGESLDDGSVWLRLQAYTKYSRKGMGDPQNVDLTWRIDGQKYEAESVAFGWEREYSSNSGYFTYKVNVDCPCKGEVERAVRALAHSHDSVLRINAGNFYDDCKIKPKLREVIRDVLQRYDQMGGVGGKGSVVELEASSNAVPARGAPDTIAAEPEFRNSTRKTYILTGLGIFFLLGTIGALAESDIGATLVGVVLSSACLWFGFINDRIRK